MEGGGVRRNRRAMLGVRVRAERYGWLGGFLLALGISGGAAGAQEREQTDPEREPSVQQEVRDLPDTFGDPGVRELVGRARAARRREREGIEHYEAVLRQRAYVGLRGGTFRRERSVIEEEKVARVRWERAGEVTVAWTGARRAVPLLAGSGEAADEIQDDLAEDLLEEADPGPILLDPGDDRLTFGGNWALHPLADSAGLHYRFSSGDTLRVGLPDGRAVTLVETRVEPRESRFDRVAGSLWFDLEQGNLVRASYRPARPFDLDLDEPDDAEDVPGLLKPIRAEISYITVDHSFHDFRWWLPSRWAFEGEVQLGRLARFPITLEWRIDDYRVNEDRSELPGDGPLPPGWSRNRREVSGEEGEPPRYVTVIVPPAGDLSSSPDLGEGPGGTAPAAFTEEELRELRGTLESLLPADLRPGPRIGWGFQEGMVRYNRVEGLSVGARGVVPLSPRTGLRAEARLGYADLEPNGELAIERGADTAHRVWLGAYRRLQPSSEWTDPFSLGSSLQAALFGGDRAPFHRTLGVEAGVTGGGRSHLWELRLFGERHGEATRGTAVHLLHPITGRDMVPLQPVRPGDLAGLAGLLRWQRGLDSSGLIASGTLRGELTAGQLGYHRASASAALVHPLPGGLAGAVEVALGAAGGDVPPQRRFFLGGTTTLRGVRPSSVVGEAFWLARMEVGTGLPGFRVAAFGDLAWAGPPGEWRRSVPFATVGGGISLLDGVFRVDVARVVRRGEALRLHLYLDGLF